MKSIIADLFNGELSPKENLAPKSEEFVLVNKEISAAKVLLQSILSNEDYAKLENLETLYTTSSDLFNAEAFTRGFSLGVKLIVEVYYSNSDLQEILQEIK